MGCVDPDVVKDNAKAKTEPATTAPAAPTAPAAETKTACSEGCQCNKPVA